MRRALLAAMLLALAAAPGAGAEPYDWWDANDVVTSPDGRNVYAAGEDTLSFRVTPGTGALELIGHTEPGGMRPQMAISPDGRFVYVGRGYNYPAGAIHVMSRDAESGLLTHEETFTGSATPRSKGFGPIEDLEMSVDGRQLYVAERNPDLVAVYDRDPETGALAERQVLYKGSQLPVAYALGLASSPDGRHLYVAGSNIAILRRDAATGELTQAGTADDNSSDFNVAVAPDGARVYGGISDVDAWRRDPASGALEHLAHMGVEDCGPCNTGRMIEVAPDSRSVFTAAPPDAALVQWRVTDGGLEPARRYVDGQDGITGMVHPNALAWSADGQFAYVAAAEFVGRGGTFYASSGRGGSVAAFRRSGEGLEFVGAAGPGFEVGDSRIRWGPGGITINDGALYTNDPNVQVTVTNGASSASLRLANSAAELASARALRITRSEQTYPWRLGQSGPERSVKRVHVRFTPLMGEAIELFDDIVLDERPPELLAARIKGSHLLLKARDNRSGVRRVQVTTSRKKPGAARKYRSSVSVGRKAKALHVRVIDGAGNRSAWRTARRP